MSFALRLVLSASLHRFLPSPLIRFSDHIVSDRSELRLAIAVSRVQVSPSRLTSLNPPPSPPVVIASTLFLTVFRMDFEFVEKGYRFLHPSGVEITISKPMKVEVPGDLMSLRDLVATHWVSRTSGFGVGGMSAVIRAIGSSLIAVTPPLGFSSWK